MKKFLFVVFMFFLLLVSYILGAANVKVVTDVEAKASDNYIDINSEEFYENYIDMREVTGFSATDTGIMLYLEDGSGYYWER